MKGAGAQVAQGNMSIGNVAELLVLQKQRKLEKKAMAAEHHGPKGIDASTSPLAQTLQQVQKLLEPTNARVEAVQQDIRGVMDKLSGLEAMLANVVKAAP